MLSCFGGWRARLKARLAGRLDMVLENLALRHQLIVLERGRRFRGSDRLCWCVLSRFWSKWRKPLMVVQPATVLRWRRIPWWRHLRWHHGSRGGRPRIATELQSLIRRMDAENRLWGSMRILGELRKLGFNVTNTTVRRYRATVRRPRPRQSWATFFYNHEPYLKEALRDELSDRARRILEALGLRSPRSRTIARRPLDERPLEIPAECLELIEERWSKWLCRCPTCERAPPAARDYPDLRRDAA